MLTNFWEGLGGKIADQWIAVALTPAFVFWIGGFFAWISRFGWEALQPLGMQLANFPIIIQGVILVCGLLVIVVSSIIVQQLDASALRFLEGYWPQWLKWFWKPIVRFRNSRLTSDRERWDKLQTQKEEHDLTAQQHEEQVKLDLRLRLTPFQTEQRMPTKLGNILRAAENRSADKYGLDSIICWPRFWLILSDDVKKELTESRANLDNNARIFLWSIFFLIWGVWAWWVIPIGLLTAFWAYHWALNAAEIFGDLLESAFDLNRFALYEALRWEPPTQSTDEVKLGEQLTEYLFRGTVAKTVRFQNLSQKTSP